MSGSWVGQLGMALSTGDYAGENACAVAMCGGYEGPCFAVGRGDDWWWGWCRGGAVNRTSTNFSSTFLLQVVRDVQLGG